MLLLFGQLQLLALPVKAYGGSEYTPELMVEQIVVIVPGGKVRSIEFL